MNLRPPGYEPDELPSCSTPRHSVAFIGDIDYYTLFQQFCQEGAESFFAAEAEDENTAADLLSRKPAATPIHAPPRGATNTGVKQNVPNLFQFTPLREGRRIPALATEKRDLFQFTPLREGRRKPRSQFRPGSYFNSRPSARGDKFLGGNDRRQVNFNSRPSARGDGTALCQGGLRRAISIHAPPRGAT